MKAEISGFISRVVVTQEFENPFQEKIEAVYTFPLPQNAAVDDMTMMVGDRTIRGKILPREEAQAVYEGAKARGASGQSARSGTTKHLHAISRKHSSRRADQDHDQLRRNTALRRRRV